MAVADAASMGVRGRVFDVQRFSVHDGPGIRTTVFLQGCPLRCAWCHNPEGVDARGHLSFRAERCVACGFCLDACTRNAHTMSNGDHDLDRQRCVVCGACASECWARALEIVGRDIDVEGVMSEVRRDAPFYLASDGGVTLSGGEPLAQPEFAAALLRTARTEGIRTCVETCGYAEFTVLERILPDVDLFLFDIKDTDDHRHRRYTGVSNRRILANLRDLHDRGAPIRLRLPLVPGFNDREDHLSGILDLCRALPRLLGVEILPYHPLGNDKYEPLGLASATELPETHLDDETLRAWVDALRDSGVNVAAP